MHLHQHSDYPTCARRPPHLSAQAGCSPKSPVHGASLSSTAIDGRAGKRASAPAIKHHIRHLCHQFPTGGTGQRTDLHESYSVNRSVGAGRLRFSSPRFQSGEPRAPFTHPPALPPVSNWWDRPALGMALGGIPFCLNICPRRRTTGRRPAR
jgi:hypothetical protein